MRNRLALLATTVVMMLVLAAPAAMADPFQLNTGDAWANNTNITVQTNVGVQSNPQVAVFGSNYSNQQLSQGNYNATLQNANAFAGNALFGF